MAFDSKKVRVVHDSFAFGIHFGTIFFIYQWVSGLSVASADRPFVMQLVSLLFHGVYGLLYIFADYGIALDAVALLLPQNKLKWVEYAITATAGAVAVSYASQDPNQVLLGVLVVMSASQQYLGYQIDTFLHEVQTRVRQPQSFLYTNLQISLASAFQVAEFVIVSYIGNPRLRCFYAT